VSTAELDPLASFDPFTAARSASAHRYLLLDVFADRPLQGNQLAVFPGASGLDGDTMQAIARELKLSETVFVLPAEGEGDVRVRIFTPSAELPFAGHPVLGTAVVVAGALQRETVTLETGAGPVRVTLAPGEGRARFGEMAQPVPSWQALAGDGELLAALGVAAARLPVEEYCNGPRHIMVSLDSEQTVAALDPDLRAVARVLGEAGVSCFAGRYKSRMFAPGLGVDEDPATGSAAGPLAVHLARHGEVAFGQSIEIRQGVEIGRPSTLRARAEGSAAAITAVAVGGSAVLLGRGELWL
jgi:trans-2,3-dihydro-3-hydroxyanthranilate isomerase